VVCGTPLGTEAAAAAPQAEPKPQPQETIEPEPEKAEAAVEPPAKPEPAKSAAEEKKETPAQAQQAKAGAYPPQAPPPPDHPSYQQQYQQHYQRPMKNWEFHPIHAGQPNQCPRCRAMNVVYYYNDGTAYCATCYYRFYWRRAQGFFDEVGRGFDKLMR
jgi:hypothetical protein